MYSPVAIDFMVTPLHIKLFILSSPPTPAGRPLSVTAKRYRSGGELPQDGITLLLLHGLGQHEWFTLDVLYATEA
jgi:hypothetical protein